MMQVLEAAFRRKPAAQWRAMFTEHQLSADIIESCGKRQYKRERPTSGTMSTGSSEGDVPLVVELIA
jgi:hypothetical protein